MASSEDFLLNEENKQRCISDLKKLIPLRTSKSAKISAAVLIPLIKSGNNNDNVGILYEKRSPLLKSHAREVCFPGGKVDPSETPIQAAIRESNEELGLLEDQIDIWTEMPPIADKSGSSCVVPVVGEVKNFDPASLVINNDEVVDYFVKDVYDLHHPKVAGYTQFRHWTEPNSKPGYSLPIYNCEPYPIWGMTAIITFQFLSVFLKGRTQGFRHKLNFQTPIHMKRAQKK